MLATQRGAVGADRGELTAPESWVLLNGPRSDSQPFKLGLTPQPSALDPSGRADVSPAPW